jgi:capsid protein
MPGAADSFARGYEAVKGPFDEMRREAVIETRGEDKQLPAGKRLKITNLQRDMLRNSPMRISQDQQLRVNIVGPEGGKLHASFPTAYKEAAAEVIHYFNKVWFPKAEFTYRLNFNWVLKSILTSLDVGGDMILVFDDGILSGGTGTGRIRAFESDEIADVPRLEDYFSKGHTQSQGFVYNGLGMFCGAFVSTSQRGRTVFDPAQGIVKLKMDPFSDETPNWIMLGNMRRFNQGRGISSLTGAITTMIDQHETSQNEALAAKWNSKLVAQVLHESGSGSGPSTPSAFADAALMGNAQGGGENVKKVVLEKLKAIGVQYQDMPEGLRMELFDTKRPNARLPDYLDYLSGLVGGSRGLTRVFATLKAQTSYTAYRGEQIMAWQTFRDDRKDLERRCCDWIVRCVISRAVRLGLIHSHLPDGWEDMIAWTWPKMIEVSEKEAQSAIQLKMQNGLTSLTRELGPGEFEKVMEERAAEKKRFDEAGLVYPGETTVSGAIKSEDDAGNDDDEDEENPLIDEPNKGGTNAT